MIFQRHTLEAPKKPSSTGEILHVRLVLTLYCLECSQVTKSKHLLGRFAVGLTPTQTDLTHLRFAAIQILSSKLECSHCSHRAKFNELDLPSIIGRVKSDITFTWLSERLETSPIVYGHQLNRLSA